ncbi:type II toxin-antitoxin system VapC family toxin [Halosimplex rubrum]|uniref:Type II toxin-antitoxin system VapC family toxin n=1 Tax=Halosimplex rubrum TaxID=869889 RepID=A0A7D5TMT4_9EURY|nr:type II toxin-antitoxin system VapC family toxin [Halosimplex rubrum]QLH78512.1 type II toxin-antitoxin system VapC family toxin [Halosimplex rubrum]
MIVLDRDVLVKLTESEADVVQHLQQYSAEEWTIPSLVAWESYKAQSSRSEMLRIQSTLRENFDRILQFTDDTALEAAYLDEKLRSQGVSLDAVDLLNVATAHAQGGTFITHNKRDFDKPVLRDLVDVDVIDTE